MMNKKLNTRALVAVALMSALISVSAMISIPSPIPFTLQTFGVFFALFFLGGRFGSISVFVYISIGALGIPVFSGFSGGIARLFDAGGGYIFGFLFASLIYWLMTSVLPKSLAFSPLPSAIALLAIYVSGALWYTFGYLGGSDGVWAILLSTALPFIIPDAIKIFLAYLLSKKLKKIFRF